MVTNGQNADQTVFNAAFISRVADSGTVARLALSRAGSGDAIPDAQLTINDHESRIDTLETDVNTLETDLDAAEVTLTDHETRISDNETAIVINLANSPKSNFSATADPVSSNDSTENYLVGSRWVNVTDDTAWVAVDVTATAAVWKRIDGGGGAGGGSTLKWVKAGSPSPVSEQSFGLSLEAFDSLSSQEIYALLSVPSSYAAGSPISLAGGQFFCSSTSGNVFLKTQTALINSSTVLGTFPNTHSSTNSELTVNATSNTITSVGVLDLTDSSGEVNGVSVVAGDKLRIRLFRDNPSETVSASADALLLIDNFEPTFS